MKSKAGIAVLIVLSTVVGFVIGNQRGQLEGEREEQFNQRIKSIEDLKTELRLREKDRILSLINYQGEMKKVDEGGLFKSKIVTYLSGRVENMSSVCIIKDMKFRIDFYSKTNSKIDSQELTLYEFINPYNKLDFKEKISWPVEGLTYIAKITEVTVE